MNKKLKFLIKFAEILWLIFLFGGIVAIFAATMFFRHIFSSLMIGGMTSIFFSLWFAFWKIKLEAKQNQEFFEKIIVALQAVKEDLPERLFKD